MFTHKIMRNDPTIRDESSPRLGRYSTTYSLRRHCTLITTMFEWNIRIVVVSFAIKCNSLSITYNDPIRTAAWNQFPSERQRWLRGKGRPCWAHSVCKAHLFILMFSGGAWIQMLHIASRPLCCWSIHYCLSTSLSLGVLSFRAFSFRAEKFATTKTATGWTRRLHYGRLGDRIESK